MYHSLSFEDYCNGMVREENKSDGTVKYPAYPLYTVLCRVAIAILFRCITQRTVNMSWTHSVIVLTASKQSG